MARERRVLYVQYANPAAYPPVLNSGRILADAGWQVRMLGAEMDGTETLRVAPHQNVTTRLLPLAPSGRRRQAQYARFLVLALAEIVRTRPAWVYASDPFSAPVAVAAKRLGLARVAYHEHDAPGDAPASGLMRSVLRARLQAARTADLLVVPNQTRLDALVTASGRTGPAFCVWNVPAAHEVAPARAPADGPMTLYYHGSLNALRLPLELLLAMAKAEHPFRLHVVGYETIGSRGFVGAFRAAAGEAGVADRVTFSGPLDRLAVLAECRKADVGIVLMPGATDDPNMSSMVGASVKAFDYLASGLALLVSDLPEWCQTFVEPGYAIAADPRDVHSLTASLNRFAADPAATRRTGEVGRQRVADDWIYERVFAPVIDHMTNHSC